MAEAAPHYAVTREAKSAQIEVRRLPRSAGLLAGEFLKGPRKQESEPCSASFTNATTEASKAKAVVLAGDKSKHLVC